jgi:hypothetical protein
LADVDWGEDEAAADPWEDPTSSIKTFRRPAKRFEDRHHVSQAGGGEHQGNDRQGGGGVAKEDEAEGRASRSGHRVVSILPVERTKNE